MLSHLLVEYNIYILFPGHSVLINTIMSPLGGVFSLTFDGVLLMDNIDTFNADGELCFRRQYPPFVDPPVDLNSTIEHSITLAYIGLSPHAPNGTSSSIVQFDSITIPQLTINNARRVYWSVTMLIAIILISALTSAFF
jgi:hypothetical protein